MSKFKDLANSVIMEAKLDKDRAKRSQSISVFTNKKLEKMMADYGLEMPPFPHSGEIKHKGKVVGRISNFDGATFTDIDWVIKNKKLFDKLPLWYNNERFGDS
jgi:hypothetical protein